MQKGLWLKVVYPCLALVAPFALVVAHRLTTSEKETRDVGAEKVENQKLLGLSFQEKGMLDMALATFNKLPFTEDMKLVYLHLGLDYENRGHRDKAFLVYKKVFDVDPGFEDVAQRMERLSQAGVSGSLFGVPTGVAARTPTPVRMATAGSPLAGLVSTPLPSTEIEHPTELAPTARGASQPTALEATAAPPPTQLAPQAVGATAGLYATAAAGPPPSGPAPPGARLGRYEVERHLGRGGMGDVYLVRDTVINRRVALKTIRLDTDLDPKQMIEMRQRFYREAQTAGQLNHPNIVTVYDVGEDLGMSYIVMEFVEGQTLTQWMKKQRFSVAADQARDPRCGAGARVRARERRLPPRRQARQHHARNDGAREGHGLRDRPGRGVEPDQDRERDGHPRLHVPRAGERAEGRRPQRHLLARRDPLRAAHRPTSPSRATPARR